MVGIVGLQVITPVSYTHLDVYKRQGWIRSSISVTTFGTGKIADDQIEKLIRAHFDLRPYGIVKMLDLIPVSYTHLDVYKRQAGIAARSRSATR